MMKDIERICTEPTSEDRDWFPEIAGCGDVMGTLRHAWSEYRDESFVLQYLSPKLIRDFRFFAVADDAKSPNMEVASIHNERGYRDVRRRLGRHYDVAAQDPDLRVTDADLSGSRRLVTPTTCATASCSTAWKPSAHCNTSPNFGATASS